VEFASDVDVAAPGNIRVDAVMDAEGFIAFLRASSPAWHDDSTDILQWIRGHRNASWRLKPTAWRPAAGGNPLHHMIDSLTTADVRSKDGVDIQDELNANWRVALAWTHAEKLVLNEFRRMGLMSMSPTHNTQ